MAAVQSSVPSLQAQSSEGQASSVPPSRAASRRKKGSSGGDQPEPPAKIVAMQRFFDEVDEASLRVRARIGGYVFVALADWRCR